MPDDELPDAFTAHDADDYSGAQPITDTERRFLAMERAKLRLSRRGNHNPTMAEVMQECRDDPAFADGPADDRRLPLPSRPAR